MDFPTFDELHRVARDEALARNGRLRRAIIERPGSDANIYTASSAAVGDEVIGQLARVEANLFLDSARHDGLDRLLFDWFTMRRKTASAGVTSVQFTTAAPAAASFVIPANTRIGTSDGVEYLTTTSTTYLIGSVGPVTVAVRSALAGLAQQVREDTLTSILSQITGVPSDLAVTNPTAATGASDEEQDDDFRERGRAFFTTAPRGTKAALVTGALSVAGVQRAAVFEGLDTAGRPNGYVTLVVADQFTDALVGLEAVPPTYATQSQVLADSVEAALDEYRAAGVYVRVVVGSVVVQPVTLALRFIAGVDVDAVAYIARVQVANAINSLNPGEDLQPARLIAALRTVVGLDVTGDEILSPPGIVEASAIQVIRTTLTAVRASTVQPDRALAGTANPDAVL